ncbi:zinc finger protein 865 [Gouania willdenowi]|uniref:Zinc finger protein 865-like n=1 Tax=Gouania willdenowi TaxID=441366 RepID=A0A8C5DY68_GOUWI|nr:zinc finger protein 865-like [Gouania willdenowi]
MLGLQGNASSSKVYRCVACADTFTGLASLLVHQASHASQLPKASDHLPVGTNWIPQDPQCANTHSSSVQPRPTAGMCEGTSPSFYICDCGEEFQDFGQMLDHKSSHVLQMPIQMPLEDTSQHASSPKTGGVSTPNLSSPSHSKSLVADSPILPTQKTDVHQEKHVDSSTNPQGHVSSASIHVDNENLPKTSATAAPEQKPVNDLNLPEGQNSAETAEPRGSLPTNTVLMKMLASAYMNQHLAPKSESLIEEMITPKQEIVPLDITPQPTPVLPNNAHSVAQVRRLLAKPGTVTKAPSISRIIDLSRKKVVSLTKSFSPVVVLETRQTLIDYSRGFLGRYQCGRCRRVFQNIDRLTEHHYLHKKERIKCCRRCKQLIIGRLPLPNNHVCPQLGNKAIQPSIFLKNKPPPAQKLVPFHSLNNAKKVFYCPLCKHSYARRWNLKKHKCLGPTTTLTQQAKPPFQKIFTLRSNSSKKPMPDKSNTESESKNVSVSTDVSNQIKVEVSPPNTKEPPLSQLAWSHPAKLYPQFASRSSTVKQNNVESLQKEEENRLKSDDLDEEDIGGEWTSPLDDEMEVLGSAGKYISQTAEPTRMASQSLRYFVRDGVKRYPCNRCQKTYSRAATLSRHLRLCGVRPLGVGTGNPSISQNANQLNANRVRAMFPCFVCGRMFNRKDNMMTHIKRCQLMRTMPESERGPVPISKTSTTDRQSHEEDGGNWGIMSLPTVLPRRVTCECGAGFTSPRLLLEHLQKHAQESYTCPTCGETVSSWADYEIHLQIHMHPHHQMLKGLTPQRSQPLLLRFQQQAQPQALQAAQQQQPPVLPSNSTRKQQRIACTKCGNTFASHHSLRRHISWNRCKGVRVTNQIPSAPKTYHCSQCNSDFPNSVSLIFHQRSGACKPHIKPVRCPVCLRWFGTVQSLQKHLLTHKQSTSFRCDVCQGTYQNLKSLQNHRRRIHRIMAGDTKPTTDERLTA